MLRTWFITVGLLTLLAGCQTMPTDDSTSSPSAVYHFVAIWMKDPADIEAQKRITEQVEAWGDYPGVLAASCGPALPGERAIVQDYDFGVLLVFANEAALRAYEQDPEHEKAVREVLAPAASQVQVFDFSASLGTSGGVDRSILRQRQYQHYREFANR